MGLVGALSHRMCDNDRDLMFMTRRKPKKRGKKSATFSPTSDSSSVGQTTRDFLAWDEKLAQASKRRVEAAKKLGLVRRVEGKR